MVLQSRFNHRLSTTIYPPSLGPGPSRIQHPASVFTAVTCVQRVLNYVIEHEDELGVSERIVSQRYKGVVLGWDRCGGARNASEILVCPQTTY